MAAKKVKLCHKCGGVAYSPMRFQGNIYHATCLHKVKADLSKEKRR